MHADYIVTTADGRKHRVLYASKGKLFVKCAEGRSKPAYKICAKTVVKSEAPTKVR